MADLNYALASLGAVATASGTGGGTAPSQAIDGNDTTYWEDAGNGTWYLMVDLGAPKYITSVRIINGNGGNSLFDGLAYSQDGATWLPSGVTPAHVADQTLQIGGLWARHWRLQVADGPGNVGRVATFAIYGPTDAPPNPTAPLCEQITAWLDAIDANFVPCVEDWLAANP